MQNRKAQTWLIVLGVVFGIPVLTGLVAAYWPVVLVAGIAVGAFFLIRHLLVRRYFSS